MSGSLLPSLPHSPRYHFTFAVPVEAVDRLTGDVRYRRTRIAGPLMERLLAAGYVVEDWRRVLQATSVVAREAGRGVLRVTATVPRPPVVPEGELNPEAEMVVEYVGGAYDGHREPMAQEPVILPSAGIDFHGTLYFRTGYDLAEGVWHYQARPEVGPEVAAADDDAFGEAWDEGE